MAAIVDKQCGNGGAIGARGKTKATLALKAVGVSREEADSLPPDVLEERLKEKGVPENIISIEKNRKEVEQLRKQAGFEVRPKTFEIGERVDRISQLRKDNNQHPDVKKADRILNLADRVATQFNTFEQYTRSNNSKERADWLIGEQKVVTTKKLQALDRQLERLERKVVADVS